jgi:hypothetical protein
MLLTEEEWYSISPTECNEVPQTYLRTKLSLWSFITDGICCCIVNNTRSHCKVRIILRLFDYMFIVSRNISNESCKT